MRVKALQSIYYGRRMYAVGDEYDMDDREDGEARILSVLRKIEIVEQPQQKATTPPTYHAAALEPEAAPSQPMTTDNTEALTPGKRVYRRRDMRAER